MQSEDWIKIDLHIHTLDNPKDALDYSAHELLERARALGFRVLAITLHDAVFDRAEVFRLRGVDGNSGLLEISPRARGAVEGLQGRDLVRPGQASSGQTLDAIVKSAGNSSIAARGVLHHKVISRAVIQPNAVVTIVAGVILFDPAGVACNVDAGFASRLGITAGIINHDMGI